MSALLQPQQPQGSGVISRLLRFVGGQDPRQAVQGMVNPIGMATMPGMVSGEKLVPTLLKLMQEKGVPSFAKAEQMAMDAATAGKIGPDQFKMAYDAIKAASAKFARPAESVFSSGSEAPFNAVSSSVAPAGVEGTKPLEGAMLSNAAKMLRTKFGGGQ